jgi:membrane-bound metal-dependent hydrolase YbcI (DUF457 family)
MSGWKGHVTGAIILNTAYVGAVKLVPHTKILDRPDLSLQDWQLLVGLFVIAVLFGLFPDVDTNSNLGLLAMTPIIGKHRGWTHSKPAMLLVPAPILVIPYLHNHHVWTLGLLIYGAAVTGYFSHLLLDGLIVKWIRFKT